MTLNAADKKWFRQMVRAEIERAANNLMENVVAPVQGGYDGASEFKEDEWSEEGRKRPGVIGFVQ